MGNSSRLPGPRRARRGHLLVRQLPVLFTPSGKAGGSRPQGAAVAGKVGAHVTRMRAQVRKTTLHDPADPSPSAPAGSRARAARRRRVRVRSRLLVGVLLTGLAVAAAGAPAVHGAYARLTDSQRLVDDAELGRRALALSHLLADEREVIVVAVADGDPGVAGGALSGEARERTDRAIDQLPDDAGQSVHDRLAALPAVRDGALAGESTAVETYEAYTAAVDELDAVFREVSRTRPDRAADPTGDALPDLVRAVHASSATRGLVLAGLRSGGEAPELAALAHVEAARERAAVADFTTVAGPAGRDAYERAMAGEETAAAEELLASLTDTAFLSADDRAADEAAVHEALSGRTARQQEVLTSLAAERAAALQALNDDDMTSLQLAGGVVLVALLVALAVSVQTARSLTRPLAAVRLGTRRVALDPAGQEPVKYTGRNDEFAEVVASVNALRARTVALQEQATSAVREAEEAARDSGGLRMERDRLLAEQSDLTARLAALHGAVHGMFAHHAQRLLALAGEQLAVIEGLEEHEADPDRLAVLFSVDHLAARMRRHGENLLLLAGAPPVAELGEPQTLIDVARAAVSEIERYELVETTPPPPPGRVVGVAARDVSHLLAELLDNATAFSPTGARVRLTARWVESDLLFSVEDEGVGLSPARLAELNARLVDPVTPPPGADQAGTGVGIGMGLYTVARLAARHGLRCWLDTRPTGGTIAQVVVPGALIEALPDAYQADPYTSTGAVPTVARPAPRHTGAVPTVGHAPVDHHTGAHPTLPHPSVELPPEHGRATDTIPGSHPVTESGLPLRSRATATPATPPTAARERASVDAEELRRRLGGFQRGAREGHRDAAGAAGGPYPGESGEGMPS
ncbi:hypothetical protein DEH69_02830 [Streptomyces sp. PT12]|nr:hypothetical protein DEH69_02830 [Streptomyces sp. PT12]